MTDDLVQRLRGIEDHPNPSMADHPIDLCKEAADHIEALVKERDTALGRIEALEQAVKDSHLLGQEEICMYRDEVRRLEAALREIAGGTNGESEFRLMDIARDALEGK